MTAEDDDPSPWGVPPPAWAVELRGKQLFADWFDALCDTALSPARLLVRSVRLASHLIGRS